MKGAEHLVFDFDDTLIHTFHRSYELHSAIAAELGAYVPTKDEFKAASHMPWERIIEHFWPGEQEAFHRAFIPNREAVPPVLPLMVDSARETLEHLRNQYTLHLLTHRDSPSLYEALELLGISGLFASVHPLESLPELKPNPGAFGNIRRQFGSRCIYVGDSVADFLAARGAGFGFVGVLTGATSRREFLAAGLSADRILESVPHLPALLKQRLEVSP